MKFLYLSRLFFYLESHLTRGAWIEMMDFFFYLLSICSRTSHEVRGLKYSRLREPRCTSRSHLTRGAWIEILKNALKEDRKISRTSHEVRGLKYCLLRYVTGGNLKSHLTRGAWIEMQENGLMDGTHVVAPHTRCVD